MQNDSDKKCPICGKPVCSQYAPFCSKRCADVDLNRWLNGAYIMHTDEKPTDASFPTESETDF